MTDYSYLSEKTRNAVTRAYRLSKQMHYSAVPALSLMIAISEQDREMVSSILRKMGVDMSAFCTSLASSLPLSGTNSTSNIPISAELEELLEMAISCSRDQGGTQVDPVHVFQVMATSPGETRDILHALRSSDERIKRAFQTEESLEGTRKPVVPPSLQKYARDLTQAAREGKLEPVIGREAEIIRAMQILLRKTKNNPVFVGPAGTGKTAIAEGVAQKFADGEAPEELLNLRVFSLSIASLIAGAGVQGEFEDRLKQVMKDVAENNDIILFVDEIHLLIGAGGHGGAMDAANILKPALARGEIRMMGATTTEEYTRYIESDKAFERRFQKVTVEEPDEETAISILRGIRGRFEAFHGIAISDDAVQAAVRLSRQYITDRYLPDKAIDLLDEAAARARMEMSVRRNSDAPVILDEDAVRNVVTAWTGIPISRLEDDSKERLVRLEDTLSRAVIGQAEAVSAVSNVIRRNRLGLGDAGRPIGSFLFLGETGVGKTALAKTLANYLFGSQEMMVRIDMSEYQQEHMVSRLFGAPPGYVGYDQGGQLTEAVRHKPYSVILLDEVEKAHPKVFESLLQVLDDGRMTDGQGRTVNFRNTIIIMTSNVKESQLRSRMTPEFINRIDEIICFHKLGHEDVLRICRLQLEALKNKMAACGLQIEYDEDAVGLLCEEGFSPDYGARPVKRALNRLIVDGIASALLHGDVSKESLIKVSTSGGKFVFRNPSLLEGI